MDSTETVAQNFRHYFVHVSGFKKADPNPNLFGAMSMKYLVVA